MPVETPHWVRVPILLKTVASSLVSGEVYKYVPAWEEITVENPTTNLF